MSDALYIKSSIDSLIDKFNNATLPKEAWTHEAHLVVAIWYVKEYNFFEAVCRLKSGIILLNATHGTANTGSVGYHETLTVFWTKIISVYIELYKDYSIEQIVTGFMNTALSNRNLPYDFYDKELLLSIKSRAICIAAEKELNAHIILYYLHNDGMSEH